ncbi:hypothetical protein HMSSN036_12520 [Paenibacillus macerans]|nr:hypothetical protein HMSSN036_12520 [Paenibacillus macerans]
MKKVGLVMRKIQFTEAQGPRVFAERLRNIAAELGVEIVFISPERHVSGHDWIPGYEHEKGIWSTTTSCWTKFTRRGSST